MHVNPRRPNILQDKLAAAQGRNLRDIDRDGKPKPPHMAKVYPYASDRQTKRQQAKRR